MLGLPREIWYLIVSYVSPFKPVTYVCKLLNSFESELGQVKYDLIKSVTKRFNHIPWADLARKSDINTEAFELYDDCEEFEVPQNSYGNPAYKLKGGPFQSLESILTTAPWPSLFEMLSHLNESILLHAVVFDDTKIGLMTSRPDFGCDVFQYEMPYLVRESLFGSLANDERVPIIDLIELGKRMGLVSFVHYIGRKDLTLDVLKAYPECGWIRGQIGKYITLSPQIVEWLITQRDRQLVISDILVNPTLTWDLIEPYLDELGSKIDVLVASGCMSFKGIKALKKEHTKHSIAWNVAILLNPTLTFGEVMNLLEL